MGSRPRLISIAHSVGSVRRCVVLTIGLTPQAILYPFGGSVRKCVVLKRQAISVAHSVGFLRKGVASAAGWCGRKRRLGLGLQILGVNPFGFGQASAQAQG